MSFRRLLLATTSEGKIREQRRALEGLGLELVTLADWPELEAPEEPGPDFAANAAVKALYYARETGEVAVGEDSGLVVDALDGAPGLHSARWLGKQTPYDIKNREILKRLEGLAEPDRTARFVSAVALASGGEVLFADEGICEGRIALAPAGEGGFGYDPIFFYPPLGRTTAELTRDEKNEVSHRGRSMAKLRTFLTSACSGA